MMSRPEARRWIGRCMPWLVLVLLVDLEASLRRGTRSPVARLLFAVGIVSIAIVVGSSVLALGRVRTNVKRLMGDSVVGIEATVAMRDALRECRLRVLRAAPGNSSSVSQQDLLQFRSRFTDALAWYRAAAFTETDRGFATALDGTMKAYIKTVEAVVQGHNDVDHIAEADNAAARVMQVIERAYNYNRDRMHNDIDDARGLVDSAFAVLFRVGVCLFALVLIIAGFALFGKWVFDGRVQR